MLSRMREAMESWERVVVCPSCVAPGGMAWETEQPAGRTLHVQFSEQAGASLEKFEHSLRFCEVESVEIGVACKFPDGFVWSL